MVHRDARRPALINRDNPRIACEKAQQLDSSFPLMSIDGSQKHCDLLQLAPVRWEYRGFAWNHLESVDVMSFKSHLKNCWFAYFCPCSWLSILRYTKSLAFWHVLTTHFSLRFDPVLCGGVHLGTAGPHGIHCDDGISVVDVLNLIYSTWCSWDISL